ncbi:hypothetical protein [Bradyrhizobium sp. CB3481]|uniref:hypothetical protein n=1 Tax=Bradyrhizobium sp. CB3481 TaxID=3039158 RepID=UPI0024B258A1|nr:hypothetical protein [Bradyrhizobium sp. CB3481]WFU14416.1 hypothetical protein QA643_24885 [Bradyrhizobium sp. CB3481]
MENFGYFLLGSVVTVAVSVFFYMRAGDELKREAKRLGDQAEQLRKLHELALFAITHPEAKPKPVYDEAGRVIGVTAQLTGRASAMSSAQGSSATTEPPAS